MIYRDISCYIVDDLRLEPTHSRHVACNAERAEMGGMMHCGGEAQIAAQGTASPACGSRGMSCGFAVLHAFGASELAKFGPCA